MASKKSGRSAVDVAIGNIETSLSKKLSSKLGPDPIIFKGKKSVDSKLPPISFGTPSIDAVSNCGGIPRGKLVELFGPESSGKSFLTLKLIASAQKQGINCCLIDAEQSFQEEWAEMQGVDVDSLFRVDKALSGEILLEIVTEVVNSGEFGLVVVDSTAALIPQKELDGEIGDQDYALLARMMSKACKKIKPACGDTNTTCVFINQLRMKMGVTFGNPFETPGGKALKFYSDVRISVWPSSKITGVGSDNRIIGRLSKVKFEKNKIAPPFGETTFEIIFFADAMNPVCKLCELLKEYKMVSLYKGELRLNKSIMGTTKNVETGTYEIVALADYLIENNLVIKFLEKAIEYQQENNLAEISPDILEMLDDPKKIISPSENLEDTSVVEEVEDLG